MKNYIKILILFIGSALLLGSCTKEETLQEYYINSQENENFLSVDIPRSIVTLKDDVSQETKEAFNSIKKLNILAFKVDDSNKANYEAEKTKIEKILKSKKFNDLIRVKHKNAHILVKYKGDDDSIDEFIVYGSDDQKGFAVARVLGKEMKPDKIVKMMKDIDKIDEDGVFSAQIEGFMKGVK
jgi:hypothetical protein